MFTKERKLHKFFQPKGITVIGASQNPAKVGNAIVKNLLESHYPGPIFPVNPKEKQILGLKCYPSVKEIPGVKTGKAGKSSENNGKNNGKNKIESSNSSKSNGGKNHNGNWAGKPARPVSSEYDAGNVELAVIAIPARGVLAAVRECAQNGIHCVIVITAGFKETGPDGAELEKELAAFCREQKVRLLGPNCVGLIHTHTPLNASFARGTPRQGNVAFISQSGAILLSILDWSMIAGTGFSYFVSLGNKADLQETDFLAYAARDPSTKVILCYLEDIVEGQRFLEVASRISARKPIIILKAGASPAGAKAASSHTGALTGTDHAYEAAFRKSAVLRARNMGELFDLAVAFAHQPLPAGDKVAVITNSGGPGILATDQIENIGLQMACFTTETSKKLRSFLPPEASIYNPVDVLGDADAGRYSFALGKVLNDPQVEGVIALLCPSAMVDPLEIARAIKNTWHDNPQKPLLTVFMGGKEMQSGKILLQEANIPCYTFPERAVTALAGMARYMQNKVVLAQRENRQENYYREIREDLQENKQPHASFHQNFSRKKRDTPADAQPTQLEQREQRFKHAQLDKRAKPAAPAPRPTLYNTAQVKAAFYDALKERRVVLLEHEGARVLQAFQIPVATTSLAGDPREAAQKAEQMGFPVVLKIASPKILHKSDIGGVIPNLTSTTAVENSFREMMQRVQHFYSDAPLHGITVQKMMPPGMEVFIGSSADLQFGPLLVFGLGGIYVNLFEDVSRRLAQNLSAQEIEEMMKETKSYHLLKGFRGSKPLALQPLKDVILHTARLVTEFPEIEEMDINPLLVYEKSVCAVDVKITLSHRLMDHTRPPREQAELSGAFS